MITRIDLRHFKCFETLKLPLHRLTLLSGQNASGKSSVMQALVLLHQTMRYQEWSRRLLLNGAALRLGSARDVIDQDSGGHSIAISLLDHDAGPVEWEFGGDLADMSLAVSRAGVPQMDGIEWTSGDSKPLRHLLPEGVVATEAGESLTRRLRGLTWLGAERLGPREQYTFDDPQLAPVVGHGGEHAVSVLYSGRDERLAVPLTVDDVASTRLRQVGAHMSGFFPGFELEILPVPRVNAVTLGIRTSRSTDFHRPGHTGFGVTQVLPIIVAAVSATPGDLLLIENPEVHLHPAGQARMGEFLTKAAAAGLQVLVETHSDHVLNGVRRAVRTQVLAPEKVALHFFRPRHEAEHSGVAQVESPAINADGDIDHWPEGFFDQFDHDMNFLAGWS